ncbi:MAG: DMT family transporter [Kofleriaceae bacterium]|nr:DMT family transporter [Myxococcales bacterium]MCB9558948.1 DMT family transporter [Kofleriaceae bacterium]MCB9570494.1 DMT family transporter [Kofleriaceae bacterium]
MPSPGELAALGTAGAWTCSSLAFAAAAERIGSLSLNLIRIGIALIWLTVIATITRGLPLPTDASAHTWLYLTLSGAVGFVLGDLCFFRALIEIGPRLTMLIQTTTPIFAAAISWVALGEGLSPRGLIGLVLVVAGVAWAVSARRGTTTMRRPGRGVLLALGGALGQAGGLILTKHGLGDYPPIAGNQIRALAALVGFAIVLTASRWWPHFRRGVRDGRAMAFAATGATLGPFIGVTLSLYAVSHAKAGVAAALMSTPPVMILPYVWWRGEQVGAAGVLGALTAVAGVALLVT